MRFAVRQPWLVGLGLLGVMVSWLWLSGQPWICSCGQVRWWYGSLAGPETSQQVFDPYTFTHLGHGLVFYALLRGAQSFIKPNQPWALGWLLVVALGLEASWEVLENTEWVISRYRATGIGAGYFGDSILNSLSDVAAMAAGFGLAHRLGWRWGLVLLVWLEAALMMTVRDSLLLSAWGIVGLPSWLNQWQAASLWLQ